MPVTEDRPAPYAAPSSIVDIVTRYRNRGLPFPVNTEVLARAGISESLIPRTLQSLQTLDLINEAGNPTDTLEGIRLAPEAEYRNRLTAWLKSAYAGVFAFVDPSKDDGVRIRDAFRGYNPVGQQSRMVTLFEGLCTEAGLITVKASTPRPTASRPRSAPSTPQVARAAIKPKAKGSPTAGLPPALTGLLESLPELSSDWSDADRDKFLATFKVVLDLYFPTAKPGTKKESGAQT